MSINWGNLVNQGRAKAIGVPWSDEDRLALEAGVPAEFVRQGILTLEKFEDVKDSPERKYKSKKVLQDEARRLGIEFSPDTTRPELIELMEAAENNEVVETPSVAAEEAEDNSSPESPAAEELESGTEDEVSSEPEEGAEPPQEGQEKSE